MKHFLPSVEMQIKIWRNGDDFNDNDNGLNDGHDAKRKNSINV